MCSDCWDIVCVNFHDQFLIFLRPYLAFHKWIFHMLLFTYMQYRFNLCQLEDSDGNKGLCVLSQSVSEEQHRKNRQRPAEGPELL